MLKMLKMLKMPCHRKGERGRIFVSIPVAAAEDNSHTVHSEAVDRNILAAAVLEAAARSTLDLTFFFSRSFATLYYVAVAMALRGFGCRCCITEFGWVADEQTSK